MAGHGGGAWKVAYADFVTAMMAFFLVMWISAQSKQVKQAVAHYFNEPTRSKSKDSTLPPAASDGGMPEKDDAPPATGLLPPGRALGVPGLPRVAKTGKGSGVQKPSLYVIHDGDRRVQGTVVVFPEDSADLGDRAKETLKQFLPLIVGKPNKIELRGHATRRPLPPGSPFQDAWQLSYARCLSVMKYLQEHGVPPERIRLSQGGPFEPHSIRADPGKQSQNSRVEIHQLAETVDELMGTREERAERTKTP
jgi:chemotaxis protein MotB